MTIKEYKKINKDWDILEECELSFADPNNAKEAKTNIMWVIDEFMGLPDEIFEAIGIVVNSYYGSTEIWH